MSTALVHYGEMIEISAGKTERDLLVELVTVVNRLCQDVEDTGRELEPRIRNLEQYKWWMMGACAGLSFAGGFLGHVIFH